MNAREIVTARIAEQARRYPDLLITPLETGDLDARDAALASAIDHAVVRRWLTLVAVVEGRLDRPWVQIETKLQAALLVGAAQLLLLERLPDHAVINETVEWAKQRVRPKAGGLVNAVLRKVAALRAELQPAPRQAEYAPDELPLHDGRCWRLTESVFAQQPVHRLAQQTSHPEAAMHQWQTTHGMEIAAAVARHSIVHAPIIVHGLDSASQAADDAHGGVLSPHDEAGFFVFQGERDALLRLLKSQPASIVQDPASAAPAAATMRLNREFKLIVDACAGRGTKTRQLAHLHPSARIIASDISPDRMGVLREQFREHPKVSVIEFERLSEYFGQADMLFLDVPCSNSGVLARRVEAKYRLSRASIQKTVDVQRQIIANTLALLGDAGVLVYSTCSIDPAENQQQAQWICKWHPMRLVEEAARLPRGQPGDPPRGYSDGGYYAVLQRTGEK